MRDKAANAAQKAARITRAWLAVCICCGASSTAAQLSDPMAPPGAAPAGGPDAARASSTATELQAIITGPERRLALINGNLVQIGERIPGDGVLLSLGSDSALVQSGDKHVVLRLHANLQQKDGKP